MKMWLACVRRSKLEKIEAKVDRREGKARVGRGARREQEVDELKVRLRLR